MSLHQSSLSAGALLLAVVTAHALPAAPDSLTRTPSALSGQVTLSWSAVPGATGYNVKRGASPAAALTTLGTSTTTDYVDATAMPGTTYFYTVTTTDASGESPPTRGIMAATAVIVDNGGAGTSFTGSWATSSVAGYFGTPPVYAGPVSGSTPTATYTFTPDLPARGNYDVYMRWTTNANRATDTPVDLVFPDGSRSLTVDQEQNNGVWMLLSNITAEAGTTASVVIRNNGADGNVVADAVQFVPRHSPWAPAADKPQDYVFVPLDDHFDGTTLNQSVWSTFAGRGEHSVSAGRLHTKLRYKGAVPIESATTADLEDMANWAEGGIVADHAQKFGYHEARLRLPQLPARGVDIAYWHGATDELLHGYEIDAPEFFNKDTDGSSNNYGFGVWDHVAPTRARPGLSAGRTWDYHGSYSTLGDVSQYVTIGLEWRTDNSQVVYINGVKVYTAPSSGMNDVESILPSSAILSTKVLDWMHPNAALSGTEATWDYARYYQKPGFLGAVDGDWAKPENWGPDGKPSPGYAAVFNMPSAPAAITVSADQELQSLFLDGATLPAHTFSGPGALRLGAAKPGDDSVTHGGILVNTARGEPPDLLQPHRRPAKPPVRQPQPHPGHHLVPQRHHHRRRPRPARRGLHLAPHRGHSHHRHHHPRPSARHRHPPHQPRRRHRPSPCHLTASTPANSASPAAPSSFRKSPPSAPLRTPPSSSAPATNIPNPGAPASPTPAPPPPPRIPSASAAGRRMASSNPPAAARSLGPATSSSPPTPPIPNACSPAPPSSPSAARTPAKTSSPASSPTPA